jgi:hypothetical protein
VIQDILVVTNANDPSTNNEAITQLVNSWRGHKVENLRTYEFQADLGLPHNLLDSTQEQQQIEEVVYPALIELIHQ